ncbi:MAG TPA: HD domain-containing protein [Solirubrobacteraceae bacterium]
MKDLTHRDEIHGDVYYDPLAVALLDTPTVQRLGRVYQLGYGHLVYRGATHTRLSHAMGAYATAGRLVGALRHNYETKRNRPNGALEPDRFLPLAPGQRELGAEAERAVDRWTVLQHLTRWAALLHDVGHVPLGHTIEDEFEDIYRKHDDFASPRLRHLWVRDAKGADSEIRCVLRRTDLYPAAFRRLGIVNGDDVANAVFLICTWKERVHEGFRTPFQEILADELGRSDGEAAVVPQLLLDSMQRLDGTLFAPYMADIVANTISADYLDYLRRDPRNLGLDVLKDDRVVSQFWVGHDHRGQARMALSLVDRRGKKRLDTSTGVVELVRQRYRFAEIVYYHKTKVAASAMLAAVFHLVGAPAETPQTRETLELDDVEGLLARVLEPKRRAQELREFRAQAMPSSLLDAEIGDESVGLLLRESALRLLETSSRDGDRGGAERALQAIALLDAIARRRLYKVCFSMDFEAFQRLTSGGQSPEDDERALNEVIGDLRGSATRREETERQMVDATGTWPYTSILLYVPPRKSQAKGIETGALMPNGNVVTLESHPAVKDAVADLGKHYKDLWRLLVLVHPEKVFDPISLSAAIDALVVAAMPSIDLSDEAVLGSLKKCCWFPYIAQRTRPAAERFRELFAEVPLPDVPWARLPQYELLCGHRTDDDQLVYGAALLDELARRGGDEASAQDRIRRFERPAELVQEVTSRVEGLERLAGRDSDAGSRERRAIEHLAEELLS